MNLRQTAVNFGASTVTQAKNVVNIQVSPVLADMLFFVQKNTKTSIAIAVAVVVQIMIDIEFFVAHKELLKLLPFF